MYKFTVYHGHQQSTIEGVKDFTVDAGVICFYDMDGEVIICFKEWSFFEREEKS